MRTTTTLLGLVLALAPGAAFAQDAAVAAGDAAVVDAARAEAGAVSTGNCQADPVPAGHTMRVETRIAPAQPSVGDRVIVTYRLFHNAGDLLEFEPDPAAFAQPGIELEYAREQPDRDHRAHAAAGGTVYGEVQVAVQPFAVGDVVVGPQLARLNANGDVVRVCTPEVRFHVRDPFGNEPHPVAHDVTAPEVVTEDALRWRWIMLGVDLAFLLIVATLAASAYVRSRPKPVVPPPPPRAPWIVAIEALDAIGRSDLLSRGATIDYYDAISDVVRRYIGGSRGFDALEMTTDEVLQNVRRTPLAGVPTESIAELLRECDLVKFARYVPSHESAEKVLEDSYGLVRRSSAGAAKAADAPRPPSPPGGAPTTSTGADTGAKRA